jgi:hypothetical protein
VSILERYIAPGTGSPEHERAAAAAVAAADAG